LEPAGVAKGLKLVPALNSYVGDMSDHGVFRENNVPYFFLSCGRFCSSVRGSLTCAAAGI
ncbi:MAG: hypothetical protein WCP35_07660, partial [Verrucomicrobiota bacterium]